MRKLNGLKISLGFAFSLPNGFPKKNIDNVARKDGNRSAHTDHCSTTQFKRTAGDKQNISESENFNDVRENFLFHRRERKIEKRMKRKKFFRGNNEHSATKAV